MNKPDMKSPVYWGGKLIEIMMAGAVALGLLIFLDAREKQQRDSVEASDWFVVNDIYIPDHEVGSNPLLIYDRTVIEPHRGFWVVEAQRQTVPGEARFFNECSGSGVDNYDMVDLIPEEGVRWDWFFGRDCTVPPGTYRVEMTKDMVKPGYTSKTMLPEYSNTFTVYAPGTMPKPGK